jgi:hypothetical protein
VARRAIGLGKKNYPGFHDGELDRALPKTLQLPG